MKVPVFSSEKLVDVDTHLGPEMKSTGEVLGIANTMEEALYKGLIAAGYQMKKTGGVLMTIRDTDKPEIAEIAKQFQELGFALYATRGTAAVIREAGMPVEVVEKIHESEQNPLTLLESGKIQYVISTSSKGRIPTRDSVRIRRKAVERDIPCLTAMDTASALLDCLKSRYSEGSTELVDINHLRSQKETLEFVKMQGCRNDYIYFNCFHQTISNPAGLSVELADRHIGIGGDGVVLICPSEVADAKMRMFNRDGSEGKMCGNAIRCVAKYLHDEGIVNKLEMTIETLSGIKTVRLLQYNGQVKRARVDMGPARLESAKVPVNLPEEQVIGRKTEVAGGVYEITCLSMGNPHCVVFCSQVDTLDVEEIGPKFEFDPLFPERVNVEFVKVLAPNVLKMRVWERGSGETMACGTGACAAAVAAVENGYCDKDTDITVKLLGGELIIRYTEQTVYLTGNAALIYKGTVQP